MATGILPFSLSDPGPASGGAAKPHPSLTELIDWRIAAQVGRRVAAGGELPVPEAWQEVFAALTATADSAVAEYTGLGGDLAAPVTQALDRGQWVEGNLATLRRVLHPLGEKVAARKSWSASGPAAALMRSGTRAAAGAQAGTLLGYVGQRVLGQYDLPALDPHGVQPEGTVWYIVPNIVKTEREHAFRPVDFRMWIALHETTHRRQFRGVDWLAGYVQGLLDEYLRSVDVDEDALRRLGRQAGDVLRRVVGGERIEMLDVLVAPEQKAVVLKMQAVMSVLEGHAEFVMDDLGSRMVRDQAHMHEVLRERRTSPAPVQRLVQQVLGLRQKMDQYALGERFVRRLHERGGMEAVNDVFSGPDQLPTLEELRAPEQYLSRAG